MVALYDIIPDIHGQYGKLECILSQLGYSRRGGQWRHTNKHRQIVFLGDFIDRGPENREVLSTVRELIDMGLAVAVMGNHELNAVHFHTADPETVEPLREHSDKNIRQHASFLREFPHGSHRTREEIRWMAGLPLWLDLGTFRVVHACWSHAAIDRLSKQTSSAVLSENQLIEAARKGTQLYEDVEVITKGPELKLPGGYVFHDKDGHRRQEVRIAWWRSGARRWSDAAISVPDLNDLPDAPLPTEAADMIYPKTDKPVFFGHYWLKGPPPLEAPNALCLDCSAGTDGPLIAYRYTPNDREVSLQNVTGHPELGANPE